MTTTIEIYWDDLIQKKQQEIQKELNMDADDNGNWDVIPMCSFNVEEDN